MQIRTKVTGTTPPTLRDGIPTTKAFQDEMEEWGTLIG
jgi:hypothetical protein